MPWWLPWYTPRSELMKLQSCRNLIHHYLGNYLEEKLTLDQLSVNFYKGTGKVCDINLDCEVLNEVGEYQNWPVKLIESHMEDITVNIPWQNPFQNDSIFKINGLSLTVQPISRTEPVTSILRWFLINCRKLCTQRYVFTSNVKGDSMEDTATGQAAKLFEESINAIQKRLKVKFENTKIRFEHVPKDIDRGFSLEFNIKNIVYCGDTPSDMLKQSKEFMSNINKTIKFEGITLYMQMHDAPTIKDPNTAPNLKNKPPVNLEDRHLSDIFGEQTSDQLNDLSGSLIYSQPDKITPIEKNKCPAPIIFSTLTEQLGLTLTLNDTDGTKQPKVEMKTIGPFIVLLSPKELDSVNEIIQSLQHT